MQAFFIDARLNTSFSNVELIGIKSADKIDLKRFFFSLLQNFMFIDITDVLVNYKYFLDRWFESFNVNVFFYFQSIIF